MSASIVCSQSRKGRVLPLRAGWDDITDLDGTVGDDHAVDQQFEQCPLPVEICCSQAFCRGRSKSRPLRHRGLLAPSAEEAKAQAALSAWAVWLFVGNEHRPATAPVAGASSAPVAWIRTALYRGHHHRRACPPCAP